MRSLINFVREKRSRKRLLQCPQVRIASTAKYLATRISLQADCKLTIGQGTILEGSVVAERNGAEIFIGDNTFIGGSLIACASQIEIGDDVLISWGCNIVDHNSHSLVWEERANDVRDWYKGRSYKDWTRVQIGRIKIHSKTWIGLNAIILPNVEIGEGSVVGAGSVVTKSVAPWTVVGGNPARPLRSLERN